MILTVFFIVSQAKLSFDRSCCGCRCHVRSALEMATRSQTLYGLADSTISLAALLIDHGDGDDQPAATVLGAMRTPTEGQLAEPLTRDDMLDNITLYWLRNTGISSASSYWENKLPYFGAFKSLR